MKKLCAVVVLSSCFAVSQLALAGSDGSTCCPNAEKKDVECKTQCPVEAKSQNSEFRKVVREKVRETTTSVVYSSRGGAVRSKTIHVAP